MRTDEAELMRELHAQHAAVLWAFALRLTGGDRGWAEDVVQETLLRAWRHPRVLDQSGGSARSWLLTVARRVVIDEWRHRSSHPEVATAEPPEPPPVDDSDRMVQGWLVAEALRRLSPQHRQVIVECYYRGHSVAEAAEKLGVPPGTVKSRTHYALRALRLALEELGAEQ